MRTFTYEPIATLRLTSTDLRNAAADLDAAGDVAEAYRITIETDGQPHAERAEALYVPGEGRVGFAWGADSDWTDSSGDIAVDIAAWLNDPDLSTPTTSSRGSGPTPPTASSSRPAPAWWRATWGGRPGRGARRWPTSAPAVSRSSPGWMPPAPWVFRRRR